MRARYASARVKMMVTAAFGLSAFAGCKGGSTTEATPEAVASSSATAAMVATAKPRPKPKEPPMLRWSTQGEAKDLAYDGVFRTGNSLFVSDKTRVGRLENGTVSWVGKIPGANMALGKTYVTDVAGTWPSPFFALYQFENARAASPTIYPLSGKGQRSLTVAPGGGVGNIFGVMVLGDTTFAAIQPNMMEPPRIEHLQGAPGQRLMVPAAQHKCAETGQRQFWHGKGPALSMRAIAAAPNGSVVAAGMLCDKTSALEIWPSGKDRSTIVDMTDKIGDAKLSYGTQAFSGPGGTVWVVARGKDAPILAVTNGGVDVIKPPSPGAVSALVHEKGTLFVFTEDAIYERVDNAWKLEGKLPLWGGQLPRVRFAGKFWRTADGHLQTLEPSGPDPRVFTDACKTPFVFLYDIESSVRRLFPFPSTVSALKKFAKADALKLVDFREAGRKLGVSAPNKATALALIDHIKANMKDEKPRLVCYAPPNSARALLIK